MTRRKAKQARRSKKAKRPRRLAKRKAAPRRASAAASAALVKARSRVSELEAENRRLREELAAIRGEPRSGRGSEGDDAPLAPGM